jgi:hypothetical protein
MNKQRERGANLRSFVFGVRRGSFGQECASIKIKKALASRALES